jgi:hypothetical protein
MTIIRRQCYQGLRDPFSKDPRPVEQPGPIPASFIRAVPVAVIKKNIHVDVRYKINVSPGYYHQGRRCGKRIGRNINPYAYFYTRIALSRKICQKQKHRSNN